MSRQPGFFDLDDRYSLLSKSGDPLERLASAVNFEAFDWQLHKKGYLDTSMAAKALALCRSKTNAARQIY